MQRVLFNRPLQQFSLPRLAPGKRARLNGWLLIGAFTGVFLLWLGYRLLVQPAWVAALPGLLGELLTLLETAAFITLASVWLILGWRRWRRKQMEETAVAPYPFTRDDLYALSPTAFEQHAATLFRQKGYRVKRKGGRGDRGVDLELRRRNGKKAIVQCKRYTNTVGPDVVRELYGTLMHERAAHAFLVTSADISDAAREWAQRKPMTLIDGATLVKIAAVLYSADS